MKRLTTFFAILIAAGCLATCAFADIISIDENGHGIGTKGQGYLANDPGPGGLQMVLTYNLPFFVHPGDVLLYDSNGSVQDIIRFNKHRVVFYSDNIDGFDSLADTSGPPTKLRKTRIFLPELGTEDFNGAFYTPLMGQPGYNATLRTVVPFYQRLFRSSRALSAYTSRQRRYAPLRITASPT